MALVILLLFIGLIYLVVRVVRARRSGQQFRPELSQITSVTVIVIVGIALILFLPKMGTLGSIYVVSALVLVGISYLIGVAALKKGRSFWAFFLLSCVASPIIMGIIVATLPSISNASLTRTNDEGSGALPASVAPASHRSVVDELTKLAALHKDGVLSEAEFNAAKAKLISS